MLTEIKEMAVKAQGFLKESGDFALPIRVPYIGMGSSYFAPLAFKYMGIDIYPEIASEYYNYVHHSKNNSNAVLLSQSGRSTEVLWCRSLFEKYVAISNDTESPLCRFSAADKIIPLLAGEEKYSSSKTYINTLLALFKGFGMDVSDAVQKMVEKENDYENKGKEIAEEIFRLWQAGKVNGLFVTGSGPNIATAKQAALILSESTKLNFHGLPMAQYDHGPKETARDSVVIQIISKGKSYDRSKKLTATIEAAGAHVFLVEEPEVLENESILNNIVPFNYMAYYLSEKLGIQETFAVGGKVTEVG